MRICTAVAVIVLEMSKCHIFSFLHCFLLVSCIILLRDIVLIKSIESPSGESPQRFNKGRLLSVIKRTVNDKQIHYKTLLQHPRVKKVCQYFNTEESQKDTSYYHRHFSEYKLVQVHGFFSPGQTVPKELPALKSPKINCKITNLLSNNPKVLSYEKTIRIHQGVQKKPNGLKIFPTTSKKYLCLFPDLTPFGTIQQIEHGQFFSKAYSHILKNISRVEELFTIETLPEKLLYQNALAFAAGFLKQKQFSKLQIHKSLPDFAPMSMNKQLNCPKLSTFSSQIENAINSGQFIFKEAHPSTKHLASLFHSNGVAKSSSLELLQTTLSYLCNKISPICHNDKTNCIKITPEGLTEAFRLTDKYFKSLIVNPLFTKISKLSTYPALRAILESIHNSNVFFHMYSTKLSYLLYLLRTLSLKVTQRPMSVSHLIFEVYSNNEGLKFFRILFNGEDLTNQVLTCNSTAASLSNLCPLSILSNFLTNGIFEGSKIQGYTEACQ